MRTAPASNTKPSRQQTTFSYDDRGRLTGKVDPVGSSVYTPDPDNNVLTHTENGQTIRRIYGDVNRLTSYTDEGGNQIGYQYDNNGNLLKLTYPGNKAVNYVYDSNNRLTTVTDWAGRVTSITYDLAGRVLSVTRPNGTVRNIGYDDAGETTQIQELMPSPNGLIPIAYYKLVYDEAGRMANEFIAPLPAAYSEPAETVVPDADNRISTFNTLTVVHDADGNMTSGPLNGNSLVTHVYDARNRLTSVGASGTAPALSYGYDSEGNRTSVTQGTQTARYVVNPAGSQVLIRTRADGTQTFYVYGLGLLYDVEMTSAGVETGVQHTYHYDSRGSTIAVTSAAGAVTDRVQYSVYGRITLRTGSTDTPFLYNGRYGVQTDANGLYYMRARYYNPYICRFINADPAGFGGGMNWYAFADGNPVSLTDPFGLGTKEGFWSWIANAHDFTAAAIDNVFNMGLSLFTPQPEPGATPAEQQQYAAIGQNFMQTFGSPLAQMGLYQPGGGPDNAAQVTMAVLPFIIKAPEVEVPESGTLAYDVGTYDALKSRSLPGDGLDIHHVGQAHPMEDLIPGYDRATAPAIALPEAEHSLIPTLRGTTSMTPRDVLANDIQNLRNLTVAPNAVLQQLIELNKKMYPSAFSK